MFCVYITTYLGNKLPKYYVGSTSIKKIEEGYRGSVHSIEWKYLWELELKQSPTLFQTKIISVHSSRKEALEAELKFQVENNVVSSDEWVNKSLAQPNGFFGMDVSGSNNPMFGKIRRGEKHKGGENISNSLKSFFESEKSKNHRSSSSQRMKENNPSSNHETMLKIKNAWKESDRNKGEKNGMFGKEGKLKGKKLYNNGLETKAFIENEQPDGWFVGRLKKIV